MRHDLCFVISRYLNEHTTMAAPHTNTVVVLYYNSHLQNITYQPWVLFEKIWCFWWSILLENNYAAKYRAVAFHLVCLRQVMINATIIWCKCHIFEKWINRLPLIAFLNSDIGQDKLHRQLSITCWENNKLRRCWEDSLIATDVDFSWMTL